MTHHRPARLACALLVVSALSAGAAMAQGKAQPAPSRAQAPVAMLCAFEDKGYSGWVPEIVMVTRQANNRIEVFDPILQTLVGKPILAVITADSAKSRSYGWALAGVRNASGQRAERIDFRLTVSKTTARAEMVVTPKGYDNVITGEGICSQASVGHAG